MCRRFLVVVLGVCLAACASGAPSRRPSLAAAGREVITAAEIVASNVTDVYQAVSQLRPEFLRRRLIPPSLQLARVSVDVFVDEVPFGSAESLRQIPLERVRLIRYMSRTDAEIRFGGYHPAGVILVTTLK